ncbi:MAG: hypothetical protein K6357_07315 [Elusimicrobiota bacterium]
MKQFLVLIYSLLCLMPLKATDAVKIFKPKEVKLAQDFSLIFEIEGEDNAKIEVSTVSLANTPFVFIKTEQKGNKLKMDLIPFEVGITTFPAIELRLPEKNKIINTYPINIEIKPLFNLKETDRPRDIAGVISFLWWLKLLIALLIILITYIIYKKLSKKKKNLSIEIHKDTRTPYQKAMDEINNIKTLDLLDEGKIKEYYSIISDILRRYLQEEFLISALEMTTNDLIKNLKTRSVVNIETIIKTKEFLQISDLVKFAKYIPERQKAENDIKELIELLNVFESASAEKKQKINEQEYSLGVGKK